MHIFSVQVLVASFGAATLGEMIFAEVFLGEVTIIRLDTAFYPNLVLVFLITLQSTTRRSQTDTHLAIPR